MTRIGVVVIGRNEGERLARCLASLAPSGAPVVYVDSGSTDGSPALAARTCRAVVALDPAVPFTAARARNAGFERLLELCPDLELVQFVDGDCEVAAEWLPRGLLTLETESGLAVVFGRRRERFPRRSVWNRLCDMEWNVPVGPARSCGGDALMRVSAFRQVGGFDGTLIAGEEPELCLRLRRAGWGILRIDAEMTLHDAAMTRFGQWWTRSVRAGHAYAERCAKHGAAPEWPWLRKNVSILVSGGLLPAVALVAVPATGGASLLLPLALYATQTIRSYRATLRRGAAPADAWLYAAFSVLAAFPECQGQLKYLAGRARSRPAILIEYKRS
ncbi:glycosyltransferase family 2 protein [Anaeromyxobacter oryzae]|uniref:Glycosyltransferase 2-like domain-containing protein n=1 Tax=Anaeromyxobacter oryzae TaxID=2918170 RepID=A0ABN6MVR9_9BACT|nr:glycosyltransferase [Anaeromyxobacter oryzae]BDG04621.1 hypothetical protein AMOR_36170 [Anaeromyxobacter oryzae]